MSDKHFKLKTVFGHDSFRPLQEDAIDTILAKKDLLMILPTGGGKSLCYQLPSLLMPGVTIVVSPLLALMQDQVMALHALDISADMISSMQDLEELELVFDRLRAGDLKLLYVAPERFKSSRFMNILSITEINFFVVDEAHCVSEWGHEFREDYRKLNLLRKNFPKVPIAAFTATATPKVQKDIAANLKLVDPHLYRGPVFRENLEINAAYRAKDGRDQLLNIIRSHPGEVGIVYSFTRNSTESIAAFLQKKGIKARCYHAGLPVHERQKAYREFVHDKIQVVVATIAFGMGIDKSNIRFVVHMSLPKTIENYYQEIGRAGRDGLPSRVYLLHSISDKMQRKGLIDQLDESPYKDHAYDQLEEMAKFSVAEKCRHGMLTAYFEQLGDNLVSGCETNCDNCMEQNSPDDSAQKERVDITREAQMFLSAIIRSEQRFGSGYIIDLLRGSKNKKILDNAHENLSVYGIGMERTKPEWITISQRLQELEVVTRGEFQELIIKPKGVEILKKQAEVSIKKERLLFSKVKTKNANTDGSPAITEEEQSFFERLRSLRSNIATSEKVPAYIVFNDKTLIEMSSALPVTRTEMLEIGGVGEKKYDRFGKEFIDLCLTFKKELSEK
ncbi:MAG: DNA helicase RecQ [Leptospirales bacterium]